MVSKKAQEFIGKEIEHHIKDLGMKQKQAIAVAYEEARNKGFKIPRK